ncbi:Alcohol acetyltransferase [Pyrenophora seminiperda CCB06]|uniref:Alcohol acetyltransferase n=1 Tax=Pyrenophora seminiperda CCB06 TaxID=1302712 RepID=A0A3M7M0K8_9PLEO|nr:Alcohol acetyltransferase [Pyrenophora seminiperda CCB06]
MPDPTTFEKLRPCGRLETHSTARHHLGLYKNVGFSAQYKVSSNTQLSLENHVYGALRHVISHHPNLSAITLNEDQSYPNAYFARIPAINLRTCVEFLQRSTPFPGDGENDEELDQILVQQHSRDFKQDLGSKPFWRVFIVTSPVDARRFTATWVWHHALADGISGFIFHDSFLAGLNLLKVGDSTDPVVKSPNTALLPPLEELHPMPISWPFFLRAILGSILPSLFARRPAKLWTGKPVPVDVTAQSEARCQTLVFSKAITTKLAQASRRERTSVTATLQCLLTASLFSLLPAAECECLSVEGPMSVRRFLDVKDDQMTDAVAQYDFLHKRIVNDAQAGKILQYFSWDTAREVKSVIAAEAAKGGDDNFAGLLKYVPDMHGYLLDKVGKPRTPSVKISNVGVWQNAQRQEEDQSETKWSVERMVFSQSPNLVTNGIAVSVVTGADGNAVVSFCWVEAAVGDEFMKKVIDGVREGVEELVKESKS